MHGLGVKTSPVQGETKYRVSIFFFTSVIMIWQNLNSTKPRYSAKKGNWGPATTKPNKPGNASESVDKKNPSLPHMFLLSTCKWRITWKYFTDYGLWQRVIWLTYSILKTKNSFILTAGVFYACLNMCNQILSTRQWASVLCYVCAQLQCPIIKV